MISKQHIGPYWRLAVMRHFVRFWPGQRVLDAGCSDGFVSRELAKMGCDVLGIDVATEVIEENTRRCAGQTGLRFAAIPIERLTPAQLSTFDTIISLDVLMHLDDPESGLRALRGLVRPGGLLYMTIVLGDYAGCRWATAGEVRDACRRSGWLVDTVRSIYYSPSVELANRIQRLLFSVDNSRRGSGPVVNDFSKTRAFALSRKYHVLLKAYWIPAIMLRLLAGIDRVPFVSGKSNTIAVLARPQ
ncbi:MAG: methyltransferase domain-containing protein [Candidatus Edwardsbacteria bacterium]|nr:methyltransferase domain-containing protein [Candidatus Edwardsbacteria bacterium]